MQTTIINIREHLLKEEFIETAFSFKPFVNYLKQRVDVEQTIKSEFYRFVLNKFKSYPHLETDSLSIKDVNRYKDVLELVYTILSPAIDDENKFYWALSGPVPSKILYSTDAFFSFLTDHNDRDLNHINDDSFALFQERQIDFVYRLILQKLYNFPSDIKNDIVYAHTDPATHLPKYYRIHTDTNFIDITVKGKLPQLSTEVIEPFLYEGVGMDVLQNHIPLGMFSLEGFSVITIDDITAEQAIENIRALLVDHTREQNELYPDVIRSLKTLSGNPSIEFGLLPFLRVNGKLIFDSEECAHSMLIKAAKAHNMAQETYTSFINHYIESPGARFFSTISDRKIEEFNFLNAIKQSGVRSYAILPVFYNRKLAGILEVYSAEKVVFYEKLLSRLQNALPLIAQLLQYTTEQFDLRINDVIKTYFTSLQQPVEWKFNEAAWHYLLEKNDGNDKPEMGTVTFEKVHPLYAAIDIRDSTIINNAALQKDMDAFIIALYDAVEALKIHLPKKAADKLVTKFLSWLKTLAKFRNANDENMINNLVQGVITPYLIGIKNDYSDTNNIISLYEKSVHEKRGEVYANRRALETSIRQINSTLNRYFEQAQARLQKIYPCYFEKFRSDGVEYDIYTGQALAPQLEFTPEHLKQFRSWQLKSLFEVARITNALKLKMPVPLDVASLIFVHSSQIDICFRNDERRFDVEGYYNIRYEVIKKRIDKVCIRGTKERLTQPGKIAIVYFNDMEAEDYITYIKEMQTDGKLKKDTQFIELEDLQGVTGLKALRVGVNLDF